MPPIWRIELLGWLRATRGQTVLTRFRRQKTGQLLAYLACYGRRPHPREQLIELLWPEGDPEAGRNNLSKALSSLRHQLEPPGVAAGSVIVADRLWVRLNEEAYVTDVAELEAALGAAAASASATEQTQHLVEAVELYRGELLPGCYEEWVLGERARLGDAFLHGLRQLVVRLEGAGEVERAIGYARRAVCADPLREEAHCDLMRLLAESGQLGAALRQYRELERVLGEQLGVEPSAASRALARGIQARPWSAVVAPGAAAGHGGAEESGRSGWRARRHARVVEPGTVTLLAVLFDGAARVDHGAVGRAALGEAFDRHGGQEVRATEDSLLAAFARPSDAAACAVACQRLLAGSPGEEAARVALHTAEVERGQASPAGAALDGVSALAVAAHAGQILCSEDAAVLLRRHLPLGSRLADLGVYRLPRASAPERLFQLAYAEVEGRRFPPLRAEPGYGGNLPVQLTRFFGREEELGWLRESLRPDASRLVTLTGPGGSGKTRLALEVARQLMDTYCGRVWVVALGDLHDAQRLAAAVRDALGLERSPTRDPLEQVREALSRDATLLLLDTFEHLVDEGAPLVQQLLEGAPALACLVTSRERLGIAGEREYSLSPLPTPGHRLTPDELMQAASVRLFLDRAQAVRPDFQVTSANARAVAELCNRLEGVPLALELAAPYAQVLTTTQMLSKLTNRLDAFANRRPDIAPRHRTLRATLDWSYELLSEGERVLLRRLSVFVGGWTLGEAEAICGRESTGGEILHLLLGLVSKSLVLVNEHGEEARYGLLDTVREYAWERLVEAGEDVPLVERHRDWFLGFAKRAGEALHEREQETSFARLEAEHDNLRAAVQRSLRDRRSAAVGLRLCIRLSHFWAVRGYFREGLRWLEAALAAGDGAPAATRAEALYYVGLLAEKQGDHRGAIPPLEESIALWRPLHAPADLSNALYLLAVNLIELGEFHPAGEVLEESLQLAREAGDEQIVAWVGAALAQLAMGSREFDRADRILQESLAVCRKLRTKHNVAVMLFQIGEVALHRGDFERADKYLEECLETAREVSYKLLMADACRLLAMVATERSDRERALALFKDALALFTELSHSKYVAHTLGNVACTAAAEGDAERALRLAGAASQLLDCVGATRSPLDQDVLDRYLEPVRRALGDEKADHVLAEGRAMTLEQAIACALSDPE